MSEKFLDKAYETEGSKETKDLYDRWSDSYETEVSDAGYATPGRLAQALAPFVKNPDEPILDFGCGTGLAGLALRREGFSSIDGMDISAEMMAKAAEKEIYRTLTLIKSDQPLPIKPGDYRIIVACGVIGVGGAPIETFDAIMQLLPKGGLFALSFNDHTLSDMRYNGKLNEYLDCSAADLLFHEYGEHLPGKDMKSDVYILVKR